MFRARCAKVSFKSMNLPASFRTWVANGSPVLLRFLLWNRKVATFEPVLWTLTSCMLRGAAKLRLRARTAHFARYFVWNVVKVAREFGPRRLRKFMGNKELQTAMYELCGYPCVLGVWGLGRKQKALLEAQNPGK